MAQEAGNGKLVEVSTAGGVRTIVLRNPPANCYSHELMRELDAAILEARFDESVHVIILRGAGDRFFCAGADIEMLREADSHYKYYFCLHANETLCRLEQTPKLTIAALNGHCVGGGLEVALACDLRVARRGGGKAGLPEVNLGVLPGTGGTQRLARLLGRARAIEWMASGKLCSFEEAAQVGLVQHVWESAEFEAQLVRFADSFCPPHRAARAVGFIKRSVLGGVDLSLSDGLALERELQQQLFQSADAREGIASYLEKRAARFEGR